MRVRVAVATKGGEIPLLEFEKEMEFLKFGDRHMSTLLFRKDPPPSGARHSYDAHKQKHDSCMLSTNYLLRIDPFIHSSVVRNESNRGDAGMKGPWTVPSVIEAELACRRDP